MAVIMLVMLGVVIFSMMIFSGSQTKSMRNDIEMWQARELAISGLKVAGEKLRDERWYGQASVVGTISSKVVGGGYVIVCEDTKRVLDFSNEYENAADRVVYDGQKYSKLAVLDHIDVFSRGFYGKQSVVAYGRFIMGPEPAFLSKSTEGLIRTDDGKGLEKSPFTLKRMVALTVIRDNALFDISLRGVRNRIRNKVKERTTSFINNYSRVNWNASAPTTISATLDLNSARAILGNYWGASSGNGKNIFLRDRIKDLVLEGTPVDKRSDAPGSRSFHIKKPPSTIRGMYPQLTFPPPVNVKEDFPGPDALEALELETGALVSSDDYRELLSYNTVAIKFSVTWDGNNNYSGPTSEGPVIKPYTLAEGVLPVAGVQVDSVLGFFEKYFQEGTAEVLGSDAAVAFSKDVIEEIQMSGDGGSGQTPSDDTEADSWENNPEIVIEPGDPEPPKFPTSGHSPGTAGELGSEVIPPSPGGGGNSGGGSYSGT